MAIEIDAIYHGGAFHPQQPVPLPEGAHVRVAIQSTSPPATPTEGADPLAAVIGIADGPTAGDAADRHDDYLYGKS
jgi:predicted DNA-binding antitoxin AbrB/MazE fold protein